MFIENISWCITAYTYCMCTFRMLLIISYVQFHFIIHDTGISATELTCNPDPAALCPNTTLLCTCTGTGNLVRWVTNKTGVFNDLVGATFVSSASPVGSINNQGGFNTTFVNDSVNNLTTTLQVNAVDVNGVRVDCSIGSAGGSSITNTTIPRIAGKLTYSIHIACNS